MEVSEHLLDGIHQDGFHFAGNELTQRDLIAQAFAGDNVAAEFEAEKEAEAERELPKIEAPSVLPGWGAWASTQKEPKWLAAAKLKAERYIGFLDKLVF